MQLLLSRVKALSTLYLSRFTKETPSVGVGTDELCCYYFSNVNFVSEGQAEI